MAAVIALVGLDSLSAVGVYLSRDRTASSPAPQTVTVTKSPKAPSRAEGADGVFLSALGSYGIGDNGTEAVRQRFMEFGHQTCFSQLLSRPQPLDTTVENILAAENRDIAGNPCKLGERAGDAHDRPFFADVGKRDQERGLRLHAAKETHDLPVLVGGGDRGGGFVDELREMRVGVGSEHGAEARGVFAR